MISFLNKAQSIVDDNGIMDIRFRNWADDVTRLQVLVGEGSPEGVISGEQTQFYLDTAAGTVSDFLYMKVLVDIGGDETQGWIVIK